MSIPRRDVLLLALLCLPQVLCGTLASVASSDTSRDIFFAQQIASGSAFPLTGPVINASFHLGPLWYYIVALPLLVFCNASAVTGWVGLLASSQFPLAYVLGTRLGDRHDGLVFALCLALPGWLVTSFASLTHPSIVIPSLIYGVLCAMAYRRRPDMPRAIAFGSACC